MDNNNQNMAMEWEDSILEDGQNFVTLAEGDYNFIVTNFERGRFPGSEKLPPCNKAVITLAVDTDEGRATIKTDIILYRSLEWRISAFFRCIGLKKHGERLVMDWTKVLGSEGRAHFKPRQYTDKWNNRKTANDVDYFIDYDSKFFSRETSADDSDIPF